MRIAIVGYGKMGKEIEQIALERGHEVSIKINSQNSQDIYKITPENTDIAIEFSKPELAIDSISTLLKQNVGVVVGTTGWYDKIDEVAEWIDELEGKLLYASNFSLGVNLFFRLNELLAEMMEQHRDYKVSMEEIHHTEKLDSPSGTALTLAQSIQDIYPSIIEAINEPTDDVTKIGIVSKREPNVPGTHIVKYESEIDEISIQHIAKSRKGFALGAVIASEYLNERGTGLFDMQDVLEIKIN